MGTRRAVKACYFVVWNSLTPVLSLGIAAYAGLPVFLGAGGATGLAWFGGVRAALADAEFLGLSPAFLCVGVLVLPALGGLVSLPVVPLGTLVPGLLCDQSFCF